MWSNAERSTKIKESFLKILLGIHHHRIKYPDKNQLELAADSGSNQWIYLNMNNDLGYYKKMFVNYLRTENLFLKIQFPHIHLTWINSFIILKNKKIGEVKIISENTVESYLNYLNKSGNKLREKYSPKRLKNYIFIKIIFQISRIRKIHFNKSSWKYRHTQNFQTTSWSTNNRGNWKYIFKTRFRKQAWIRDRALMETMYASGLR